MTRDHGGRRLALNPQASNLPALACRQTSDSSTDACPHLDHSASGLRCLRCTMKHNISPLSPPSPPPPRLPPSLFTSPPPVTATLSPQTLSDRQRPP